MSQSSHRHGAATVARHGQLPRSSAATTALKYLAAVLAVTVASAGSVVAIAVWNVADTAPPGVSLVGESGPPPDIGSIEGGANFLLVGSDSGGGDPRYGERGGQRNDVTILLHISEDHSRATVVSFPRDMFVAIPACPTGDGGEFPAMSRQKINESLSYGGLACTVQTVSELTGLDIPFAAKIEFNGVIEMANAIGGVQVCVATAIHDRQIGFDLEAGMRTLQGWNASQFLRVRYGVGDGSDTGRISNQTVFLSALFRKVKTAETLANPAKLYGLAMAAAANMELSNSLKNNVNQIISLALALKDIDPANIVFAKYPTFEVPNGVAPIEDDADALIDAIKADQPVKLTGSTGPGSALRGAEPGSTPPASPPQTTQVSPSPSGSPTGLPGTAVELPDSVTGQTAAQETCSKGQTAGG